MSVWQHARGGWYLQLTIPGGRKEKLYLGKLSSTQAYWINDRVTDLRMSRSMHVPPSPMTAQWASCVDGKVRKWLIEVGLLDNSASKRDLTIEQWWDEYVASRTDYKRNTLKGWKTARKHAISAFSGQKLDEINVFQANTFARDMAQSASSEHASKIVERLNQLFEAAIQAELITKNPFSGIRITAKRDKTRNFYVESRIAQAVLKRCKVREAKVILALARWCGLRVPHEPMALQWSDIDFQQGRVRVPDNTKTGFRVLPLFNRAREPLLGLREAVPLDQQYVIDRARTSAATTWRTWILDAIAAEGIKPWPKLFHNLRASCRTDLEEQFESHVCDAWLGHSTRVAKDHYLMVKPSDWTKAQEVEL